MDVDIEILRKRRHRSAVLSRNTTIPNDFIPRSDISRLRSSKPKSPLLRWPQRKKKAAKKKENSGKGNLLKLPQPWKSKKGGLRHLSLNRFPPLFEKASAKNAAAFSQLQQVRRRLT